MNYRTRMRNLREDMDLTQREVAAVINKSQQGYSHIEEGRAELKIDARKKLNAYLKIPILGVCCLTGCGNQASEKNLEKITVAEVTHSVFYAPQ